MRKRVAILLALSLLMGALSAAPAVAGSHEGETGDGGVYLALGDSVPAGFVPGDPQAGGGYPDILFDKLEKKYRFDTFLNLSCSGDDTLEMLGLPTVGIGPDPDGSICYGAGVPFPNALGGNSQVEAAVGYLLANPGEVELITLTIGANDIFRCNNVTPQDAQALCLQTVYGIIMGGTGPSTLGTLGQIISTIRNVGLYEGPIVAMNYYQPSLALSLVGLADVDEEVASVELGNSLLEGVYNLFDGVHVADVEEAFKTSKTNGKTPKNVKEICKLTLMCEKVKGDYVLSDWVPDNDPPLSEDDPTVGPQPDIHPSEKGHKKIAKTFEKLIKKHKLIDKHKHHKH